MEHWFDVSFIDSSTYCQVFYSSNQVTAKYCYLKVDAHIMNAGNRKHEACFGMEGDLLRQASYPAGYYSPTPSHIVKVLQGLSISTFIINGAIRNNSCATVLYQTVYIWRAGRTVRQTLRSTQGPLPAKPHRCKVLDSEGPGLAECGYNNAPSRAESVRKHSWNLEKRKLNLVIRQEKK